MMLPISIAAACAIACATVASAQTSTTQTTSTATTAAAVWRPAAVPTGVYDVQFLAADDNQPLPVGEEWSVDSFLARPDALTDKLPVNDRNFLGRFGNDAVSLSLDGLPAHTHVRVSVMLLVIHSWDGPLFRGWGGSPFGPDVWSIDLSDGPDAPQRNLVRTTFSNTTFPPDLPVGFMPGAGVQAFPSPWAGDRFPAQTGAASRNSLGYVHPQVGQVQEDATYEIVLDVPHAAPTLTLTFAGEGLGAGRRDEAWGIGAIRVEAIDINAAAMPARAGGGGAGQPALPRNGLTPIGTERAELLMPGASIPTPGSEPFLRPDPTAMSATFEVACDVDDPQAAARAFGQLVLGSDASVAAIRALDLPPMPKLETAAVRAIVDRLSDLGRTRGQTPNDGWAKPDPAEEELVRLGLPAEAMLERLLSDDDLPDMRANRVAQALRRIRTAPLPPGIERRRAIALRALAIIDTPMSQELRALLLPNGG